VADRDLRAGAGERAPVLRASNARAEVITSLPKREALIIGTRRDRSREDDC
jgi:hypothetical protein